jgi:hypothetical protein
MKARANKPRRIWDHTKAGAKSETSRKEGSYNGPSEPIHHKTSIPISLSEDIGRQMNARSKKPSGFGVIRRPELSEPRGIYGSFPSGKKKAHTKARAKQSPTKARFHPTQ